VGSLSQRILSARHLLSAIEYHRSLIAGRHTSWSFAGSVPTSSRFGGARTLIEGALQFSDDAGQFCETFCNVSQAAQCSLLVASMLSMLMVSHHITEVIYTRRFTAADGGNLESRASCRLLHTVTLLNHEDRLGDGASLKKLIVLSSACRQWNRTSGPCSSVIFFSTNDSNKP
jgi:hypothetical protein